MKVIRQSAGHISLNLMKFPFETANNERQCATSRMQLRYTGALCSSLVISTTLTLNLQVFGDELRDLNVQYHGTRGSFSSAPVIVLYLTRVDSSIFLSQTHYVHLEGVIGYLN